MRNKVHILLIVISCFTLLTIACDSEVLEPSQGCEDATATYSTNVKPIIDLTCAYSGCHNGGGGAPGNYTTYEGLLIAVQNGAFVNRVIDQVANPAIGMPPDQSIYPNSQQDDLSPEQMEIIQCWIDSGFEE